MFMKIAVTYDNGNIFQHFGKTENFKIYTVEDGQILSSEVIGTGGIGHEALAGLLADLGADTVICGGLGGGAQAALQSAGLQIVPALREIRMKRSEHFLPESSFLPA